MLYNVHTSESHNHQKIFKVLKYILKVKKTITQWWGLSENFNTYARYQCSWDKRSTV